MCASYCSAFIFSLFFMCISNRKRAVRAKTITDVHAPCGRDTSGSDNTDTDGL